MRVVAQHLGPGSGTALMSVEFGHLGGAFARHAPDHGALAAINAPFVMFAVGMTMTPEMKAAMEESLARIMDALATAHDASVLYSDGSVVMVWIDTQTGKSVPLPEAVKAACRA